MAEDGEARRGVGHRCQPQFSRDLTANGAIRSFTTEATEATEAGKKGFRIRIRTLLSLRSVSVISVPSVVKSGPNMWETVVSTYGCLGEGIGAISRASHGRAFQVGQKTGKQANQRQVAAQVVHEEYAGMVGQSAEER